MQKRDSVPMNRYLPDMKNQLAYIELSSEIIRCTDKEAFAGTAVRHLSQIVKAEKIFVKLKQEGNYFRVYSVGPDGSINIATKQKSPDCNLNTAVDFPVESCLDCYAAVTGERPDPETVHGFCVPLTENEAKVGSIVVVNHRDPTHLEPDRHFVSVIANLFSAALTKLNLVEKLTVHLENQKRIAMLSSQIIKNLHTENLLPSVVASAKAVIGTNACMLGLIDRQHNVIHFPYVYNMPESVRYLNIPIEKSALATEAHSQQAIIIQDYPSHKLAHPEFVRIGIKSILGIPIVIEGEVEAVLALVDLNDYRQFTPQDVDLAEIIAMQTAVALDNAKLVAKLRMASMTDPLTGLYNRGYYNHLVSQVESGDERVYPLSMMVIDLDGLKIVNDTQGHDKGDQIIKVAAQTIASVMQGKGGISRMGGDEFAILLPNTDLAEANWYRQQILAKVDELNQAYPDLNLSLSIGIGCAKDGSTSIKELYRAADHDMYVCKRNTSFSFKKNIVLALRMMLADCEPQLEARSAWVEKVAREFARAVGLKGGQVFDFITVALVHDVGKVGVARSILNNPGPLNKQEYEEIKQHSQIGYRITINLNELANIATHILYHHERWDGKGYPDGLKGGQIPLQSRMLALLDSYEAMTSDRVYRQAMSHQEAVSEIRAGAGSQFDPHLTEIFLDVVNSI
ncbi:bifunctional diguanylate cyclase/phosphohydrolase [Desulfotomaculum nigrificans]|uniref:bifunctional diguanylate cyclase/phosphohydrolase n=1 Tax=Desulfotomaculum nigrificans TaxID=1565 RepID=UPI0009DE72DF|nr:HD domain-containing phosphohydrolase [Desulfotomaculum nigrificans]